MSGNFTPIDAGGRFAVEGLSPGVWRVSSTLQGRPTGVNDFPSLRIASIRQSGRELKSALSEFEILAGENPEIEIEFAVRPRIRGIVVDRNGNAVTKAKVSIIRGARHAWTWSVSDGTFSMGIIDAGTYEVSALAPGSPDEKKCEGNPVTVRLGDSDVSGIRLVLCP